MSALACSLVSATLLGIEAVPVTVEVVITAGLPNFSIVGMPDKAILEARERVRAAIKAAGFQMPADKIVVNLAPSDLRKTGTGFDLPIAIGILIASKQISPSVAENRLIIGELSLDGHVRSPGGSLAFQITAKQQGYSVLCGAFSTDVTVIAGVKVQTIEHLGWLRTGEVESLSPSSPPKADEIYDFSAVQGQDAAKFALKVAACGRHDILMVGPPGAGKTMLARCLPSILPQLNEDDALESAVLHSVVGEQASSVLLGVPPFRQPHHSASLAGLVGGGTPVRPGEISLAHNGVLMLDELAEFKSSVLQALRQPLEQGEVVITRAEGTYKFPSKFLLVAATNPCPCGNFGNPEEECRCSPARVEQYQLKIGGPLYDRFDIRIDVWRTAAKVLLQNAALSHTGVSSAQMREEVIAGRTFCSWRRAKHPLGCSRSDALGRAQEECVLSEQTLAFFKTLVDAHRMSARGAVKTLRIARTIADLCECECVSQDHVAQACSLRIR